MPDERAIMTYVSSYYHCFAGKIKVNVFIPATKRLTVFLPLHILSNYLISCFYYFPSLFSIHLRNYFVRNCDYS